METVGMFELSTSTSALVMRLNKGSFLGRRAKVLQASGSMV